MDIINGRTATLVGTRLALVGAVLYLLEWVAIIGASPPGPFGPGTSRAEIVDSYAAHAGGAAFSAGWFAVCLMGRVLFMTALKSSLRGGDRDHALLDLAVAAMAVSVALEITTYALAAGAARLAADRADGGLVVALDGGSYVVNLMIFGPAGVSLVAAAAAMLRSRQFPQWLGWVAVVAGVAAMVGCVVAVNHQDAGDAVTSVAALGMWVWMLVTGVLLWRRAPARRESRV